MDFKYRNTTLKVVKSGIRSLKADRIVSFKVADDEDKIRKDCFYVLHTAYKDRLKSVAFILLNYERANLSLETIAKIISQETFKHIMLINSSLRLIVFAFSQQEILQKFSDKFFGYLKYITNKISSGPFSTVDIIIELEAGIVLIERSNPPFGWALPGGFVDYGESLEDTAMREAKEETRLDIYDLRQFHTYSQANRDSRFHTISTVFTAKARGKPCPDSDAKGIGIFDYAKIKAMKLAFDHNKIIQDYFNARPTRNRR